MRVVARADVVLLMRKGETARGPLRTGRYRKVLVDPGETRLVLVGLESVSPAVRKNIGGQRRIIDAAIPLKIVGGSHTRLLIENPPRAVPRLCSGIDQDVDSGSGVTQCQTSGQQSDTPKTAAGRVSGTLADGLKQRPNGGYDFIHEIRHVY